MSILVGAISHNTKPGQVFLKFLTWKVLRDKLLLQSIFLMK